MYNKNNADNIKNIVTYRFQPLQYLQPKFMAYGRRNFVVRQKQRKQPILTYFSKNSFTYRFQPIQPLQPSFMADDIRNFTYTKHKKNSAELRIFTVIPQQQHIRPNFIILQPRSYNQDKWSYNQDNENSRVFIFRFRINQQHKQLNYMTICATVQHNNLYLAC